TDLERIKRSQRHLMVLINGVLNYSRIDAGSLHYDIRNANISEILTACEALVAPQVLARQLSLTLDECDRDLVVSVDPEKLQQIVLNLLSNAVKFTEPGGRISLACAPAGSAVAITVTDTGDGIAAEQLERIFEPFVQGDSRL